MEKDEDLIFKLDFKNHGTVYADLLRESIRNKVANIEIIKLLVEIKAKLNGTNAGQEYNKTIEDLNARYAKEMIDFVHKYHEE